MPAAIPELRVLFTPSVSMISVRIRRETQELKLTVRGQVALILLSLSLCLPYGSAAQSGIQWHSFDDGMARSKFEHKRVFLHFYADWCVFCKEMEKKTFKDPDIIESLNENFIPIRVDVEREKETSAMFRIRELPDTWFVAQNGDILGHRPGYISTEQLKTILEVIMQAGAEQQ
jgi:thioredoxin-related protein